LIGELALVAASIFSGAAFYISFAEQRARLGLDDRALLEEWKPAYKRGYAMQAPLAIIGFLMGVGEWWQSGKPALLIGGILMLANSPWTLIAIMPTNRRLMETRLEDAGSDTRALIVRWNRLHSVRAMLGAFAIVAFLVGPSL
jgi:hypothetical protein